MEAQLILTRPVKEYMTTEVVSAHPDDTLKQVNDLFDQNNIHHIPILDDDNVLLGIISKSDLLLIKDWGTNFNLTSSNAKNEFLLQSNLASDLMTDPVVFLREDDLMDKCLDIFKLNYFRAIPIVDKNKVLSGIITPYDLMIAAFRPSHYLDQ